MTEPDVALRNGAFAAHTCEPLPAPITFAIFSLHIHAASDRLFRDGFAAHSMAAIHCNRAPPAALCIDTPRALFRRVPLNERTAASTFARLNLSESRRELAIDPVVGHLYRHQLRS